MLSSSHTFFSKTVSDKDNNKVQHNLIYLCPQKTFVHYDLGLTEEEKLCLDEISVDTVSHYENYGDLDVLQAEVKDFISSIGEGNSDKSDIVSRIVMKAVNKTLSLIGEETAWVTMRAFLPMMIFNEPRWHADNYYYPTSSEQYKVAITLKGARTIFYNASEEERKNLEEIRFDKNKLKMSLNSSKIETPDLGQGSIFIVGTDYAPFHSEPQISSTRIFLSMIPGNKEQIRRLYQDTPEYQVRSILIRNDVFSYFVGPKIKNKYLVSPYENTEIIIFKLLDKEEPELLANLASIIMQNNKNIKAEVLIGERKLLQCTFSQGGVITLEDISDIFLKEKSRIKTEQDIFTVLKEYADGKIGPKQASSKADTLSSNQNSVMPVVSQKRFSFNAIHGRNTSGLFRPVSDVNMVTKNENAEFNINSSFNNK